MKIGITGHQKREGVDWSWVETQLERYLAGKPNLHGYSSLATGSDQLFAQAVLNKGGDLTAVIPMEGYRDYFERSSLLSFDQLRERAQVVELKSTKRDERAFLDAGKWIAREVDRMVAIWDGERAEGTGGTGDIVAYALALGKWVHHIDPIAQIVRNLRN